MPHTLKVEAVRLGRSVGYSEASRRLGIPESSLFNWVRFSVQASPVRDATFIVMRTPLQKACRAIGCQSAPAPIPPPIL